LLSDMNKPLGHAVGNALEVQEAIETLRGGGPPDLREHCLHVSAHMLLVGRRARDLAEGRRMAEQALVEGKALEKFRLLVEAQGGDVSYVDHPERLPRAGFIQVVEAPRSGWLAEIHARRVGEAAVDLGAGRAKKGDLIDHAVGFVIHHKVGDRVEKGEPLFTLHASDESRGAPARQRVLEAHVFSDEAVAPLPLFYD